MNNHNDWNDEEEENFNLALTQRTEELYRIPTMEPDADGLIEALVMPLRDLVIFPRMVSPIFVGRESSLLAVQEAQLKDQTVLGLIQRDPELDDPGPDDFLPIGVEMAVGRLLSMPAVAWRSLSSPAPAHI
jgi:ATP-dependent Lon protease